MSALVISVVFFIVKSIDSKSKDPSKTIGILIKEIMKDAIYVFGSCIAGFYLMQHFDPVLAEVPTHKLEIFTDEM